MLYWYISCFFTPFVIFLGVFWIRRERYYPASPQSYVQYRVINQDREDVGELDSSCSDCRTCAVIGGTGFIGSHLVKELVNRGNHFYRVLVLGRSIPVKSKRHPGVAGYVQVDMRDYDGLVQAFASVDTVFHFGAVIPNAFVSSYDTVWRGNIDGAIAVINACKAAGVKNLIYLGGFIQENMKDSYVFSQSKSEVSELILKAQGDQGLRTCVANVSIIFGQGDKFTEGFITGKATTFLNMQHEKYFMYVKTLVPLLIQLEEKLTAGDDRITGKVIDLPGKKMPSNEFFSLSEWKQSPTFLPVSVVKMMAYLNLLCAHLTNYAPLGMSLCPQIIDELDAPTRRNISPDRMLAIFGLKEVPSVREDIKAAVAEMTTL